MADDSENFPSVDGEESSLRTSKVHMGPFKKIEDGIFQGSMLGEIASILNRKISNLDRRK